MNNNRKIYKKMYKNVKKNKAKRQMHTMQTGDRQREDQALVLNQCTRKI